MLSGEGEMSYQKKIRRKKPNAKEVDREKGPDAEARDTDSQETLYEPEGAPARLREQRREPSELRLPKKRVRKKQA